MPSLAAKRCLRPANTSLLLYGVIYGGSGVPLKELTRTVAFTMMEMGRYMENEITVECPHCGIDLGNPSGCYKIKCDTCGAILVGRHK